MSVAALAATPMEELVESYRGRKITKTQVVAALIAAGATAGGAALLVQAVDSSSTTPTPAAASAHSFGIPASHSAVAAHQRHIAAQHG
jgi:hypothetical protein